VNASVDGCHEVPNFRRSPCFHQLRRCLPAEAWQRLVLEPMSSELGRAEAGLD
jgi:hypothetical protein